MGRYISGDIKHMFWIGTQNSDAASQFGGEEENNSIPYHYGSMEDFDVERLNKLIKQLNKKYNDIVHLETEPGYLYGEEDEGFDEGWWELVQNDTLVADVQLGLRIYQCIKKNGSCSFEAEI